MTTHPNHPRHPDASTASPGSIGADPAPARGAPVPLHGSASEKAQTTGTWVHMGRWLLGLGVMLLILVLGSASPANSQQAATIQPSDTLWQVSLTDGTRVLGQIRSASPDRLSIQTAAGATVELDRTAVRSITLARGRVRNGVLWPEDPNATRLFFGPTGRLLEKGEGYIGAFELVLPFVAVGVTDNLTLAGGTPIVPGSMLEMFYLAPRVGTSLGETTALSAGVFAYHNTTGDSDERTFGVLYLVGTKGSEDNAISAGLGWGFAGKDVANNPLFMLGLETRVSPRIKIISENYLITAEKGEMEGGSSSIGMTSAGIRIIGERLSADLGIGCGFEVGGTGGCGIPLLNFVYNFR